MIFTAWITPWTSSSWLLTVLCPKLDVEPCPALRGVDGLFCAFSRRTPNQCLFWRGRDGETLFLLWLYDTQNLQPTIPFALRCAVLHTQNGRWWAGPDSRAAERPAPGSEPRQAGEGRKSHPLSRALAAQLPRDTRAGCAAGCFSLAVWKATAIFNALFNSTRPNRLSTAQLQLTDLLL